MKLRAFIHHTSPLLPASPHRPSISWILGGSRHSQGDLTQALIRLSYLFHVYFISGPHELGNEAEMKWAVHGAHEMNSHDGTRGLVCSIPARMLVNLGYGYDREAVHKVGRGYGRTLVLVYINDLLISLDSYPFPTSNPSLWYHN